MHYYSHHIGDFIKDTSNLDDHHLATYMRMLWAYYAAEKPFSNDIDGIAFAVRSDEKTVRRLLSHYFVWGDDGWRHTRCDKEIEHYRGKAEKARKSANARWKNANALPTQGDRSATEPVSDANQEPITNNQEKNPPNPPMGGAAAPRPKRKPTARVPGTENYSPAFLRFWDAYPAGKRSKKNDAHEIWKRDQLSDFVDVIVEDVEARKARHWGWIKNGGEFIPGAQVYLNQQRWNDDIEDPPKGGPVGRRSAIESRNEDAAAEWAGATRLLD